MTTGWNEILLGEVLTERREMPSPESLDNGDVSIVSKIGFNQGKIELRSDGKTNTGMILIRPGDLVVSGINAAKGAIAIYDESQHKPIAATIHYSAYTSNKEKVETKYLWWFLRSAAFREIVHHHVPGGIKTELKAKRFLSIPIHLPPLEVQRRLLENFEALTRKIDEVKNSKHGIEIDFDNMLLSAYHNIADNSGRKPMGEVAPLMRRPVIVSMNEKYPQVSVRSFGRGTFQKPGLEGNEITWQKPFLVKSGDILISNIKAWEGAIAVASESDDGRYGSHRYLTCVPIPNMATSRFVCFHLLTQEGLSEVGKASPGSADRNRTLGAKALMQIPIPVPPIEKQLWFDNLYAKVASLRELQSATGEELSALLPSVLDRAFKGEL